MNEITQVVLQKIVGLNSQNAYKKWEEMGKSLDKDTDPKKIEEFFKMMPAFDRTEMINFASFCMETKKEGQLEFKEEELESLLIQWMKKI